MIRSTTAGKYFLNKTQVKMTTIVLIIVESSNDDFIKVAKNKGTFRCFVFYASAKKEVICCRYKLVSCQK